MTYLLGTIGMITSLSSLSDENLYSKMIELDTQMFNSFNNCALDSELTKHKTFFSSKVEFYHDSGGVTWDRDAMITNTKNNACGKYRRELVPGSFTAFPIKILGQLPKVCIFFCESGQTKCEGKAKFTMVWKKTGENWVVTRALSYGHRGIKAQTQAQTEDPKPTAQ